MPTATTDLRRIAANVRALRAERGWRQRELAHKADVALRTIQKIEGAESRAHDSTYGRIATALEISMATLLNNKGE